MFLSVYKAELYKIITSYRFKLVLIAILILSSYNILSEYKKFPNYNFIYEANKKAYSAKIDECKKNLEQLNSGVYYSEFYNRGTPSELKMEKYINEFNLQFYKNHKIPSPKKDFSCVLYKCIFDYYYWLPIMLLFCCDIVCIERKRNIIEMQFSSYVGKHTLYHSKYMAVFTAMGLIFLSNLLFSFIFSGCLMGFSDLSGSMRSILEYGDAVVERSIKELLLLKIAFGVIICASAAVMFIFISTVARDVVTSYIIGALMVINAAPFYFTIENGIGFSKYFFISFYYVSESYIRGEPTYNIKIGLATFLVQNVILYLLGFHIYKSIESGGS
ncbi:membrane protein [Clostridium carboxidivorans P7]|uniref:ABC-2 family transporter protein n=1 Tax=Clostridium carboxidivorans P7 TaxID=536227 RepID=C6PX37_9CLOT|nr:ABC transporter permease [Clostridium carboxidivorans]AKN31144.1 membrane protein [Clostridium carboxidivorans P7]EET86214.1 hypothetical protein CcarbDRAFT_3354 [Clostridium carboxidivorans P7]EFG88251.1 membrane protein, putative [Clostridium carboxidivorans P7]